MGIWKGVSKKGNRKGVFFVLLPLFECLFFLIVPFIDRIYTSFCPYDLIVREEEGGGQWFHSRGNFRKL